MKALALLLTLAFISSPLLAAEDTWLTDLPKSKPQTPELKAANQELSKKYAIRGYPTVIVLDADGKELFKKVGYGGTPAAEYVAELAKLKK